MIDISKIKVGDEVTVRHVVRRIDDNDKSLPIFIDAKSWVAREEIATHTPKPPAFKPGEPVIYAASLWEFREMRGIEAVLWSATGGYVVPNIRSIRHADESE